MSTMLSNYDFLAPRKILFGVGRRADIGKESAALASRAFVVSGSCTLERQGFLSAICDDLQRTGVTPLHVSTIRHEPLVSDVDELVAQLVKHRAQAGDCLLAVGGGSAIDLAKAAAALATNRQSNTVKDYLEGVGTGLKIIHPPLPLIAVPTTSGTGTEATKNAVISNITPPFKKSLRSDLMIPSVVIVDPELTKTLPPTTTAYTGMDAITQLIESYVSRRARPIPQALCLDGLRLAIPAIIVAVERPDDLAARAAMSQAALLSGLALANSGLGVAHGVAAALGVIADVPHGLACAIMLPSAMRTNISIAAAQFAELGRVMHSAIASTEPTHPLRKLQSDLIQRATDAEFAIEVVKFICDRIHIPRSLTEVGVQPLQVEALAAGSKGNSLDGNPQDLSQADLCELIRCLL